MKASTVKILAWTLAITAGAGAMLWPQAASWFSTRSQSGVVARHEQAVADLEGAELVRLTADAHRWNQELFLASGRYEHIDLDYYDLLSPEGSDIISSVTIPSLSLTVPIHHGTSDEILNIGAGHQRRTSLPVGGANTHAVVTAHSGWPTGRLFNDVPQMRVGDVFFLTTAGQHFWYQVDQTLTVLPGEYREHVRIIPGEDLVTLFTCTPVTINTHRLLVRGRRIPAPEGVAGYQYTEQFDAGLPIWALILTGVAVASGGTGKLLFATGPTAKNAAAAAKNATGSDEDPVLSRSARHKSARSDKKSTSKKGRRH